MSTCKNPAQTSHTQQVYKHSTVGPISQEVTPIKEGYMKLTFRNHVIAWCLGSSEGLATYFTRNYRLRDQRCVYVMLSPPGRIKHQTARRAKCNGFSNLISILELDLDEATRWLPMSLFHKRLILADSC